MRTKCKKSKTRAFSLLVSVFVMIGVLVVCGLLWMNHQRRTQRGSAPACLNNLNAIDGAKEQWALETKRKTGDPVTEPELAAFLGGGSLPTCPEGGIYSIGKIGAFPTCSIGGPRHSLPEPASTPASK